MNTDLITYYLRLQYTIAERQLRDFGLWPKISMLLIIAVFATFTVLLRNKTEYAGYFLFAVGFLLTSKASELRRNNFLKTQLRTLNLRAIRCCENLIIALPFLLGLSYYGELLLSGGLIISSIMMVYFSLRLPSSQVIPTPFSRFPFEAIVGFRTNFYVVFIAYFLVYKGIDVQNLNLAFSALGLVFLSVIPYYTTPEKTQLVWIYRTTPQTFLMHKTLIAMGTVSLLAAPVLLSLLLAYPDKGWTLLGLFALGYLYILAFVMAKYAAYPSVLTLPFTIMIISSFLFPPLLLILIPFFYFRSIRSLRLYL